MTAAVLVMTKAPRSGRVMTRLGPRLGADGCARLQAILLRRAVEVATDVGSATAYVAFDPADAEEELAGLLPDGIARFPQRGVDLGDRLAAATRSVFARGHAPVLVIGTDVPMLRPSHLDRACELLGSGSDVVFGPAYDGGYYLIGLARPVPGVFDIGTGLWGGPLVLEASLRCARREGCSVELLARLHDLDTPDDADAALAEPTLAPVIREALLGRDVAADAGTSW